MPFPEYFIASARGLRRWRVASIRWPTTVLKTLSLAMADNADDAPAPVGPRAYAAKLATWPAPSTTGCSCCHSLATWSMRVCCSRTGVRYLTVATNSLIRHPSPSGKKTYTLAAGSSFRWPQSFSALSPALSLPRWRKRGHALGVSGEARMADCPVLVMGADLATGFSASAELGEVASA